MCPSVSWPTNMYGSRNTGPQCLGPRRWSNNPVSFCLLTYKHVRLKKQRSTVYCTHAMVDQPIRIAVAKRAFRPLGGGMRASQLLFVYFDHFGVYTQTPRHHHHPPATATAAAPTTLCPAVSCLFQPTRETAYAHRSDSNIRIEVAKRALRPLGDAMRA